MIIEEIIDWLERSICCCAQNLVATTLEFTRKQRNAHVDRFLQIWLQSGQHCETAGHMEATNGHRNTSVAERAREIQRARILVSLHSGEYDKPESAMPAESLYDLVRPYARSDFIDNRNVDRNIGPECLARGGILEQTVENGERVRGYDRTNPLNDVTLVVIVGRLDQRQLKSSASWRGAKKHPVPSHPAGGQIILLFDHLIPHQSAAMIVCVAGVVPQFEIMPHLPIRREPSCRDQSLCVPYR